MATGANNTARGERRSRTRDRAKNITKTEQQDSGLGSSLQEGQSRWPFQSNLQSKSVLQSLQQQQRQSHRTPQQRAARHRSYDPTLNSKSHNRYSMPADMESMSPGVTGPDDDTMISDSEDETPFRHWTKNPLMVKKTKRSERNMRYDRSSKHDADSISEKQDNISLTESVQSLPIMQPIVPYPDKKMFSAHPSSDTMLYSPESPNINGGGTKTKYQKLEELRRRRINMSFTSDEEGTPENRITRLRQNALRTLSNRNISNGHGDNIVYSDNTDTGSRYQGFGKASSSPHLTSFVKVTNTQQNGQPKQNYHLANGGTNIHDSGSYKGNITSSISFPIHPGASQQQINIHNKLNNFNNIARPFPSTGGPSASVTSQSRPQFQQKGVIRVVQSAEEKILNNSKSINPQSGVKTRDYVYPSFNQAKLISSSKPVYTPIVSVQNLPSESNAKKHQERKDSNFNDTDSLDELLESNKDYLTDSQNISERVKNFENITPSTISLPQRPQNRVTVTSVNLTQNLNKQNQIKPSNVSSPVKTNFSSHADPVSKRFSAEVASSAYDSADDLWVPSRYTTFPNEFSSRQKYSFNTAGSDTIDQSNLTVPLSVEPGMFSDADYDIEVTERVKKWEHLLKKKNEVPRNAETPDKVSLMDALNWNQDNDSNQRFSQRVKSQHYKPLDYVYDTIPSIQEHPESMQSLYSSYPAGQGGSHASRKELPPDVPTKPSVSVKQSTLCPQSFTDSSSNVTPKEKRRQGALFKDEFWTENWYSDKNKLQNIGQVQPKITVTRDSMSMSNDVQNAPINNRPTLAKKPPKKLYLPDDSVNSFGASSDNASPPPHSPVINPFRMESHQSDSSNSTSFRANSSNSQNSHKTATKNVKPDSIRGTADDPLWKEIEKMTQYASSIARGSPTYKVPPPVAAKPSHQRKTVFESKFNTVPVFSEKSHGSSGFSGSESFSTSKQSSTSTSSANLLGGSQAHTDKRPVSLMPMKTGKTSSDSLSLSSLLSMINYDSGSTPRNTNESRFGKPEALDEVLQEITSSLEKNPFSPKIRTPHSTRTGTDSGSIWSVGTPDRGPLSPEITSQNLIGQFHSVISPLAGQPRYHHTRDHSLYDNVGKKWPLGSGVSRPVQQQQSSKFDQKFINLAPHGEEYQLDVSLLNKKLIETGLVDSLIETLTEDEYQSEADISSHEHPSSQRVYHSDAETSVASYPIAQHKHQTLQSQEMNNAISELRQLAKEVESKVSQLKSKIVTTHDDNLDKILLTLRKFTGSHGHAPSSNTGYVTRCTQVQKRKSKLNDALSELEKLYENLDLDNEMIMEGASRRDYPPIRQHSSPPNVDPYTAITFPPSKEPSTSSMDYIKQWVDTTDMHQLNNALNHNSSSKVIKTTPDVQTSFPSFPKINQFLKPNSAEGTEYEIKQSKIFGEKKTSFVVPASFPNKKTDDMAFRKKQDPGSVFHAEILVISPLKQGHVVVSPTLAPAVTEIVENRTQIHRKPITLDTSTSTNITSSTNQSTAFKPFKVDATPVSVAMKTNVSKCVNDGTTSSASSTVTSSSASLSSVPIKPKPRPRTRVQHMLNKEADAAKLSSSESIAKPPTGSVYTTRGAETDSDSARGMPKTCTVETQTCEFTGGEEPRQVESSTEAGARRTRTRARQFMTRKERLEEQKRRRSLGKGVAKMIELFSSSEDERLTHSKSAPDLSELALFDQFDDCIDLISDDKSVPITEGAKLAVSIKVQTPRSVKQRNESKSRKQQVNHTIGNSSAAPKASLAEFDSTQSDRTSSEAESFAMRPNRTTRTRKVAKRSSSDSLARCLALDPSVVTLGPSVAERRDSLCESIASTCNSDSKSTIEPDVENNNPMEVVIRRNKYSAEDKLERTERSRSFPELLAQFESNPEKVKALYGDMRTSVSVDTMPVETVISKIYLSEPSLPEASKMKEKISRGDIKRLLGLEK